MVLSNTSDHIHIKIKDPEVQAEDQTNQEEAAVEETVPATNEDQE